MEIEEETIEMKHKSEVDEMSHTIFSVKQKLDNYQQVAIMNREDSNKL